MAGTKYQPGSPVVVTVGLEGWGRAALTWADWKGSDADDLRRVSEAVRAEMRTASPS